MDFIPTLSYAGVINYSKWPGFWATQIITQKHTWKCICMPVYHVKHMMMMMMIVVVVR